MTQRARARSWFALVVSGLVASLVALMVPATALLVPRFAVFGWLGLTNTLAPLIAPALLALQTVYAVAVGRHAGLRPDAASALAVAR